MNEKMTCEEFNSLLTDLIIGRLSGEDAGMMKAHLSSCAGCGEIMEIKKSLIFDPHDPEEVPGDVEKALIDAVISDVAAAREAGKTRRTWSSRYLMPAMAAAIVIFVFLTGFMLGEIRSLHRKAGQLRENVVAMETVLNGRSFSDEESPGGRTVFGRLSGSFQADPGGMTIGDAKRFLESLPEDTPILSELEAKHLIEGNRRLRRLAGHIEEKPWEGGLTSGELLLVIIALDIAPDTRIPDEWRNTNDEI